MSLASGSIDLKSLKVAGEPNKYITMIDGAGIRVHEAGAVNTNFSQINSNGLQIYKGGQTDDYKIAEFGTITYIGKHNNTQSYIQIDYHSLQMIDKEGNTYFNISDLRGNNGTYTVAEKFIAYSQVTFVNLSCPAVDTSYTITVNGSSSGFNVSNKTTTGFTLGGASAGDVIVVRYTTESANTKAYTLGSRTGDVGMMSHSEGSETEASAFASHAEGVSTHAQGYASHAEGEGATAIGYASHASGTGTTATDDSQTAIGKYNILHALADKIAFVIGNGTRDSSRSDAFTVDWNGNVNIASGAKYKINGTALSASDVGAVALTDKYTRSSAGGLDWSNQTDGDAKIITKSALAFWNGSYDGSTSNLTRFKASNGTSYSFGTLASKNSLSASDVGALPADYFIFDTYSKSITVGQGATNITVGTLTQHSGYTLRGYINQNGGYTDQWLVSYGTYGSNVVAMVYSKYNGSLTQTISCTAIWTKN